jgi:hypothetical protein
MGKWDQENYKEENIGGRIRQGEQITTEENGMR